MTAAKVKAKATPKAKPKVKTVTMARGTRVVQAPECDVPNMLLNKWQKVET